MFFFLSKILAFLLMPLTWMGILAFLAFFSRNPKRKKRLLIALLSVFFIFTNPFLCTEALRLWDYPVSLVEPGQRWDAGIVLSGGMMTIDTDYDRMAFRDNTDRIMQAVHLYHRGVIGKIVISGGSGSLVYPDMKEAPLLKRFLTETGVPAEDILVETESDNTHQNALHTAALLRDSLPGASCLLITSSIHMKRALACFKAQGMQPTPYATNKLTGRRRWDPGFLLLPETGALSQWNHLIHEVSGYVMYRLMGYI